MHKILSYNKFIICLYMFRALLCSSPRGQNCIIQHLVSSHLQATVRCTVLSQPVHRKATYRCDDTRCCIIQFDLLMMSTQCSKHVEAYNKLITKKILCIMLVNYYDYTAPGIIMMIPDAVIQFDLLMIQHIVLETCRGNNKIVIKQ